MADLPRIERPQRRIPAPGELDGIGMVSRGMRAGTRLNPDGMTVVAPKIDVRGFVDEARGGAAVGESVRAIGGATMRLATEQAQAVADRQLREARRGLRGIESEMAAALAGEPDEEKYPAILNAHLEKAQQYIDSSKMLGDAKLSATEDLADWQVQQRHNVAMMQARRSFQRAGESLRADIIEAQGSKDFARARAILASPEAEKWLPADARARQMQEIDLDEEAAIKRATREAVVADAGATPEMWLERNPEPGDMDPDDWRAGQSMARQVLSTQVSDASDAVADGLATGDIQTEQDIEKVAGGRLRPAAMADAKEMLKKLQSEQWRAKNLGEAGVTKNFGLLLDEVDKYDKAKDTDGSQYAGLVFRIKTLMPEELRGEITQPLARKWNPGAGPEPPETLRSFVKDTLRDWYGDGKFGVTKKQVMNETTFRSEWVDDPPKRDAAAARRAKAEMAMAKWLRENPDATVDQTKDAMIKASGAALLPGDVDRMLRKPGPAEPIKPEAKVEEMRAKYKPVPPPTAKPAVRETSESGGWGVGLPDGPPEISTALLGDIPPEPPFSE